MMLMVENWLVFTVVEFSIQRGGGEGGERERDTERENRRLYSILMTV
jgi:hypothetical protein